ncbi:hypothetical protein BDB00DRAFT_788305 [Zychaea mexicana]|uniref:uncharacterized protein n=1 Tax=Zychaea mexicana TaxID=64656 RepID=UPI0022FE78F9|nr:uncharacterized protein BDB00DRAFT_788305 [Zychaea mexicana]KAI9493082.1 hypothetical protein BDB00DRAFT_788305 [Zychaea mexicana]
MSNRIADLEQTVEHLNLGAASAQLPTYPQSTAIGMEASPFNGIQLRRVVLHPADNDGRLRQFSWELYDILWQHVLGNNTWDHSYLTTFKQNVMPFADGLVDYMRQTENVAVTATWSDLTDTQQRKAIVLLEDGVVNEYPLKACAGYWGARLILVRAFFKKKIPSQAGGTE